MRDGGKIWGIVDWPWLVGDVEIVVVSMAWKLPSRFLESWIWCFCVDVSCGEGI
jgi:hypothetical protein